MLKVEGASFKHKRNIEHCKQFFKYGEHKVKNFFFCYRKLNLHLCLILNYTLILEKFVVKERHRNEDDELGIICMMELKVKM